MQRIKNLEEENANTKSKNLMGEFEKHWGMVPNMVKAMANSSATLESYLRFYESLGQGVLPTKMKEQIALTVAEANGCSYCVSAHCALGKGAGMSEDEIRDGRSGQSPDKKTHAVLHFTQLVIDSRGAVPSEEIERLRDVGFNDEEITEVVANIVFTFFSNYFNNVAGTVVDFPVVHKLQAA
jgi:uncharacterized peroxidase-related enzyme